MPAPSFYQSRQKQYTDANAEMYYKMFITQQACYLALEQYNPTGAGAMPDFEYRIPNTANIIKYKAGVGQIQLIDTGYSSLGAEDKKIVFKYLDTLTKKALDNYDTFYNL
jgi:hypothetical protein